MDRAQDREAMGVSESREWARSGCIALGCRLPEGTQRHPESPDSVCSSTGAGNWQIMNLFTKELQNRVGKIQSGTKHQSN